MPEESHTQRSLLGYRLWGSKTVKQNLATKQQQQGEGSLWLVKHYKEKYPSQINQRISPDHQRVRDWESSYIAVRTGK